LPDYLICFNEERPRYALNPLSPMLFLEQQHQCNMYWRNHPFVIHIVLQQNPLGAWQVRFKGVWKLL